MPAELLFDICTVSTFQMHFYACELTVTSGLRHLDSMYDDRYILHDMHPIQDHDEILEIMDGDDGNLHMHEMMSGWEWIMARVCHLTYLERRRAELRSMTREQIIQLQRAEENFWTGVETTQLLALKDDEPTVNMIDPYDQTAFYHTDDMQVWLNEIYTLNCYSCPMSESDHSERRIDLARAEAPCGRPLYQWLPQRFEDP